MATLAPSRMLTPRLALSPVSGPTKPMATVCVVLVEPPSLALFLLPPPPPPQAARRTRETRTALPTRPEPLRPRSIAGLLPSVTSYRSLLEFLRLLGFPGQGARGVLLDLVDGEDVGGPVAVPVEAHPAGDTVEGAVLHGLAEFGPQLVGDPARAGLHR